MNDVLFHITTIAENKVPKDFKGNQFPILEYILEGEELLDKFFNAILQNNVFTGKLIIHSNSFNDSIGYKIAQLIENNTISHLIINNKQHPFSDRVCRKIGDALHQNTNLKYLDIFLNIDELSYMHIFKFLTNEDSNLQYFTYLKISENLFNILAKYLNKKSKLKQIMFYFEIFKEINLLYEHLMHQDVYQCLSTSIQLNSNITNIDIIPREEEFNQEINEKLLEDIFVIKETLMFSCVIIQENEENRININSIYNEENQKMEDIMYIYIVNYPARI